MPCLSMMAADGRAEIAEGRRVGGGVARYALRDAFRF